MDEFLDMTMDEDKENQTPGGLQWERNVDLVPQGNHNQEREEQELQQALTQSLMDRVRQKTTSLPFLNVNFFIHFLWTTKCGNYIYLLQLPVNVKLL